MAGPRVGIQILIVPNPTVVAQEFFVKAEKGDRLEVPLEEVTQLWSSEIDTNFRAGGRPERWAPLAAATIQKRFAAHMRGVKADLRQAQGEAEPIGLEKAGSRFLLAEKLFGGRQTPLIDTGTLMEESSNPSHWQISGGNPAVAQMEDPTGYGLYHVVGRDTPNFMPIRDWVFISDEALDEAGEYVLDYVAGT